MDLKKNFPLVVGLATPFLMILFVAASIYVPRLFIEPKYDFLYMTNGNDYLCTLTYRVSSKRLIREEQVGELKNPDTPVAARCETNFYVHDVSKDESREVSFEQAGKFLLDENRVSPDGFEVEQGRRGGDFLFPFMDGGSGYDVYIRRGSFSKALNTKSPASSYYYYGSFRFVGWILP